VVNDPLVLSRKKDSMDGRDVSAQASVVCGFNAYISHVLFVSLLVCSVFDLDASYLVC
jgi:hypothetical protein